MSRIWRVHHPDVEGAAGERVDLGPEEAHHVHRVLRLRAGERVALFDGNGREWQAELLRVEAGGATVRLGAPTLGRVDPRLELSLIQGRGRREKMDWVVQKATEVGYSSILLVECVRSEGAAPKPSRLERWRRIAIEACKQSGRRRVPRIGVGVGLPAPGADGPSLLLDPEEGAAALGGRLVADAPQAAAVAVGPEAGLDPAEAREARERGWEPVSLGPRVLRTETAGLVAGALILHRWGDLGPASGPAAGSG